MMPISEVYNEDCMIGMSRYPDKFFDLAIVDPPYGIEKEISVGGQTNKSTVNFHKRYKSGPQWDKKPDRKYFDELARVSKNQIICGGNYFPELWSNPVRGFIFWYKETPVPNFSDGELIWTSFQRPAKYFKHRYTNILDGNNKRENIEHPTAKPVGLYKWILENYAICKKCNNTGVIQEAIAEKWMGTQAVDCEWCEISESGSVKILDTHMGSQSSRIAAFNMGFDYWGWEIDKDYFDQGNKRFKEQTAQLQIF